jgi:hypothetical protein
MRQRQRAHAADDHRGKGAAPLMADRHPALDRDIDGQAGCRSKCQSERQFALFGTAQGRGRPPIDAQRSVSGERVRDAEARLRTAQLPVARQRPPVAVPQIDPCRRRQSR